MSNSESDREIVLLGDTSDAGPTFERLEPRAVQLGPRTEVRRVLPNKERRMVGAWCFVDHYGPEDVTNHAGMRIAPHPHAGLQTVSWLLDGEIRHLDSLGSDALVVPGQLNLMTAGAGIAHSEESPPGHSAIMHGVQLWIALPNATRHTALREFTQYSDLPRIERNGLGATVMIGSLEQVTSPATAYTPIVGADLVVTGPIEVELRPDFEYGVLALDGGVVVDGQRLDVSEIGYLGTGRDKVGLANVAGGASRALLLGGEPFADDIVMWWNFIGRTHEEIVEFRQRWNAADALFGEVTGFDGDRLPAPPMPTTRLKSRGRRR